MENQKWIVFETDMPTRPLHRAIVIGTPKQKELADARKPGDVVALITPVDDATDEDRRNADIIASSLDLFEACKELLDAQHQEHFDVRLNDEETAAFNKISEIVFKLSVN